MEKEILTFNDLPQIVAQLRDEVMSMRAMLTRQQVESSKPVKENRHKPMTVEEAIEYTHIPRGTMYMKLEDGTIPATKPGRRWILYQDELDKWLETTRRNTARRPQDKRLSHPFQRRIPSQLHACSFDESLPMRLLHPSHQSLRLQSGSGAEIP